MPQSCAVADCRNVFNKASELSFHRFPTEPNVRKAWKLKCKRQDKFNLSTSSICSDHFQPDDFERDLRNELLNLPVRKILIKGSVPSVFPNRQKKASSASTSRQDRLQKRSDKRTVKYLIETYNDENVDPYSKINQADFSCQANIPNAGLLEVNQKLRKRITALREKIKNLQKRARVYRWKIKPRLTSNKTFSVSQIKKLKGQARVNWDTADIVKALSLRSISLRAYETARTSWKLPLPAPSTLRRWTHRFQCAPGLQMYVIRILGEHSSSFGSMSQLCALSFDEMGLDGSFYIDNIQDQISSYSKAQVIMARGVVEKWKQPIYFDFDTPMTVQVLNNAIIELEKANIHVVSITCDLGGENRGLWRQLGISPEKPWFVNPYDPERKVFVLADMPHLLKLIRNHVLDDGVMTFDGAVIDKDVMQSLVDTDNNEVKLCPKLNQHLIDVTGVERMRVRPAAHLLSRHSAMLAKLVYPDTLEIGNYIQIINDGFDVFNSRCHIDPKNPLLSAFGVNYQQQVTVLHNLKQTMQTSRFFLKTTDKSNNLKLKSALLPCQVGYLVSIEALLQLFQYLKENYDVEYLMTSRLLQDSLESFFSRIRGFGGPNTNPTPAEFRYRFRLVLLGGCVRPPRDENSLTHCSSNYVSADLIGKNQLNIVVNPSSDYFNPETLNISDEIRSLAATSTSNSNYELECFAGYLACRLKEKCPTLPHFGKPTTGIVDLNQPSWIQMLSRGGLLTPSFKDDILKCNSAFELAMKQLQERPNIHSNVYRSICFEFPEIRKELVNEFVKVRIKIRVKHLNLNRKQFIQTRKMKMVLQSRKSNVFSSVLEA